MTAAPSYVDDGPVAWREHAPDGESAGTIVTLHGLGGSHLTWDRVAGRLAADGWRCAGWDMPGYGGSDPFPGTPTFRAAADAVVTLLDALDVASAHLAGHSLGGMIALHTALHHPDRVDRLVLVSASPAFGLDGSTDTAAWKALRLDALDRGETPASIAETVLRSVAGPRTSDDAIAEAVAAMSLISPDGLRGGVELLPTHDLRGELGRIPHPALVIVGGGDLETPPPYSRYLADHLPGATGVVEISGAGHLLPHERPDELADLINRFLHANRTEP